MLPGPGASHGLRAAAVTGILRAAAAAAWLATVAHAQPTVTPAADLELLRRAIDESRSRVGAYERE